MLEERYRGYLIEGYTRFKTTKDRTHIDDAINLVKALSPKSFFQGEKDKTLEKRIFFHAPFSTHWSGNAITQDDAYSLNKRKL
jgi:hypothetical protein